MPDDFNHNLNKITPLLNDLFTVEAVYRRDSSLMFSLTCRYDRLSSHKLIKDRLKMAGYRFTINDSEDNLILCIDPRPRFKIPPVNIVLFLLTLITVYIVPVFLKNFTVKGTLADLARGDGIEFTLALISILFVHEMGHFTASRRRNIITSWPYFIPAPNIIGTFGAIIKSKSPFWNRRDLIEVGAAGPIAGWIVAVCWLVYGLSQSQLQPIDSFTFGEMAFSMEGESILTRLGTLALIGPAPEGYYYKFTEAAFAGWVGLLVTAINMLPIGQLDGGHVIYGLFPKYQKSLGKIAMVALILLGFQSMMWWFFAAFGFIFGVAHPPTLNDSRKPDKVATGLGIISLVILFLSFTPVPFR